MCVNCCSAPGPFGYKCNDRPGHDGQHSVHVPAVNLEWNDNYADVAAERWN